MPAPTAPIEKVRLSYLDNLKVWLTFLVVAHHVAQAYGPTGGAWPVSEPMRSPYLAPFITINAMFFMGLFFFISGYFTPGSYQRKGFRPFVTDRLLRLGIPSFLLLLILFLITRQPSFGPMWYAMDLLALSILYAALRARSQEKPPSVRGEQRAPHTYERRGLTLHRSPQPGHRCCAGLVSHR
ncbi:MAG: acyltransferase [Armatimonas sp.]